MAERKALEAVIHGRVQGVGFRAHAQDRATALGLAGHVANRWDGAVEVYAEGPIRRSWTQLSPPDPTQA